MFILFFTDDYTWNIYGTKRSTLEALEDLGHVVFPVNISEIDRLPELAAKHNPDQIWLFHSNLRLPEGMKPLISQPVIGFGISDPYYFNEDRFQSYDLYVTYNRETYDKVRKMIPTVYNRTACDFKFHKPLDILEKVDATLIGNAIHARFTRQDMRIQYVDRLRAETDLIVHAFGRHWPEHVHNFPFIDGDEFLPAVNSGRMGLDVQDSFSPLAHRMFEYAACGVPVITRKRDEVFTCFEDEKEILSYDSVEEFVDKISWHLAHPDTLEKIGNKALERCRKEHDITHRIPALLDNIAKTLGEAAH